MHKKGCDIACLQETHSIEKDERFWSTTWGRKIYFSHGQKNARGVAILFSKQLNVVIHNVISSNDGRFLILYCSLEDTKILIVNVYAPNEDSPDFFTRLFHEIDRFAPDHYIMFGDYNLAVDPLVDRQGTVTNNNKASKILVSSIIEREILDLWRHMKPDQNGFTWRKPGRNGYKFSRLDYIFVSECFLQYVNSVEIVPGFRSDHSFISMDFQFYKNRRGKGYWKFNAQLLRDNEYLEKINKLLDIELAQNYKSIRTKWEMIKLAVRSSTLQYSARKAKSKRNTVAALEKKLQFIQNKQQNLLGIKLQKSEEQVMKLRKDIGIIVAQHTKSAAFRSGTNWHMYSEKPTKYFLNLERRNKVKKTIARLKNDSGKLITNDNEILKELKSFYQKLYTATESIDTSYIENLDVPQITESQKLQADADITLEELGKAVRDLKNLKCPGTDGIGIDFIKVFYSKLKIFTVRAV